LHAITCCGINNAICLYSYLKTIINVWNFRRLSIKILTILLLINAITIITFGNSQVYYNVSAQVTAGSKYQFFKSFGSTGLGNGQFIRPTGIAIDSSGNVYVLDSGNNRVQKFDSGGTFIKAWGEQGTADVQFNSPTGIAVDKAGNVYVLDTGNNRIQKFDGDGNSLTSWPSNGTITSSNNLQVNNMQGVAVDFSGNVYQSAPSSNKVFKYTTDGSFIKFWGSNGQESGQFSHPTGIATYPSGNFVYVIDHNNFRIQKFDTDGKFITAWGEQGTANGQFKNPGGIAVDPIGNVYVGDAGNFNIQKFDSNGKFITKWGTNGASNGQFNSPTGIAIDTKSGNVYIADTVNNQIQIFIQSFS
jgi:tripartite motif-containing protein 71